MFFFLTFKKINAKILVKCKEKKITKEEMMMIRYHVLYLRKGMPKFLLLSEQNYLILNNRSLTLSFATSTLYYCVSI
jgi:hypothetical protein